MNIVEISGGSKAKKELAEKVVSWYIKKMLPRTRTLDIQIKLTNCLAKNGAFGYCMMGEDHKEFEIEIDKDLRLYEFVSTLTHELTHLKQYYRKEMVQLDDGRTRWKKKIYSEDTSYEDSPWEKEAFKVEKELAIECFTAVL